MHHPEQFKLMAKSIQNDRLRLASQKRMTRKSRPLPFSWLAWFISSLGKNGNRKLASKASSSFDQPDFGIGRF